MKIIYLSSIVLSIGLSACGQTGPLYLPKNAPKVYDEAMPKPEDAKETTTKPEPPPLPEKSAPNPDKSEPSSEITRPESEKTGQPAINPEPTLEKSVPSPKKPVPAPEK